MRRMTLIGVWTGLLLAFAQTVAVGQVVPPTDPNVPPDQIVHLLPSVEGVYPRLLFTPDQLTALRKYALTPGNPFYQQLQAYLAASNPPTNTNWLSDDTEAQRQGYWRLPTAAMDYAINGDAASFNKAKGFLDAFLAQPHWQTGTEQDTGMGAANIMLGAAIAYDCLYNALDANYRKAFHDKLLQQARDMYYLGYLGGQPIGNAYWQQDPLNNHRWHRATGMALAVLAVADENDPADQWMLKQTKDELTFIAQWLPPDGSNHEGPGYAVFGEDHLTLAFAAADRVLGTNFLSSPFFTNEVSYRLATLTPGLQGVFNYGDCSPGAASPGYFNSYLFLAAAKNHNADQQAALMQLYNTNPDDFDYGWMSLAFIDPNLTGGSINNLPKKQLFSDLGLAVVRDGWQTNNVAMSFKCGPYGGASLNAYRNANDLHYINVAHDDPDAGSFMIYARGQMFAQADGYSYDKLSSGQNTILVNGHGQIGEGSQWTQPVAGMDMTKMASITWYDDRGGTTIVEGEASGAYVGLTRYRRTAAFVQGKYILILDDIRSAQPNNITWLVQSAAVNVVDGAHGRFALQVGGSTLPFILRGDANYTWAVVTSTADDGGVSMGLKQLQATARTDDWRTGALFDAWGLGGLDLTWIKVSDHVTDLVVTGPGFSDTWYWDSSGQQTVLTQAPEPTVLMPLGALLLLARRRRRRAQK